jgi:hypothetical protein
MTQARMSAAMRPRSARTVGGIGVGAIGCSLFRLVKGREHFQFVHFGTGGVIILLVLGAAAVAAALLRWPALVVVIGAMFVAAGVVQLVELSGSTNWFDGNASFFALTVGFGLGLAAVGLTELSAPGEPPEAVRS